MFPSSSGRRRSGKPLIFNDPLTGKEFEIPAGEPCFQVGSLKEASAAGYLNEKDEAAMWAARTNLQRGYVLLWIRGALRGVPPESLALEPEARLPAVRLECHAA